MTTDAKVQDPAFRDFEKNWRKFISQAPELAVPVVRPPKAPAPWEPVVLAECVFSTDANGLVPQVTLVWNDPAVEVTPVPAALRQARPENPAPPSAAVRFDLGVHHDAFARNYYSTALSSAPEQRFALPSNSRLTSDTEAVMLTGPALFPKLVNYRVEAIEDRDTGHRLSQQTLVLRDLSPGLSYTIRASHRAGDAWNEERQFVFLAPVCPNSF